MKPTEALQQKLYDEMLSRIQQTDTNVPYRERGWFYYSRTEEGKQYPIFCRKKSLQAPEEVTLDVNALAQGKKFMSVGDMAVSPDGSLLAYTTDETGFRQYDLHVKDLRTGQLGPELPARDRARLRPFAQELEGGRPPPRRGDALRPPPLPRLLRPRRARGRVAADPHHRFPRRPDPSHRVPGAGLPGQPVEQPRVRGHAPALLLQVA